MQAFRVGLPGSDQSKDHAAGVRPRQHPAPAEVRPVVGPQNLGPPARDHQHVEHARHREAAQGPRRHDGYRLGDRVVDNRPTFQHAAFGGAVEDGIGRPDLIGRLGPHERLPLSQWHLLAPPADL